MNKWIPGITLACSLAVSQFAAAQHRDDRGHAALQDYRSQTQHISVQANSFNRSVIGGYVQAVHDSGHHRRHKHKPRHRRDGHQHRHYEHKQSHQHRRQRGYTTYDHAPGDHQRRGHNRGERHGRHHYVRPERRISRVIRAY